MRLTCSAADCTDVVGAGAVTRRGGAVMLGTGTVTRRSGTAVSGAGSVTWVDCAVM